MIVRGEEDDEMITQFALISSQCRANYLGMSEASKLHEDPKIFLGPQLGSVKGNTQCPLTVSHPIFS